MKPLPLGRSTFATLRARDEIYVDKTALIYQLAQFDSKIFLARPRRFGKSLLTSTFESLFKEGLRDFQGLAIEKLWSDHTYPVVRLDFSEIKEFANIDEFKTNYQNFLLSNFREVGFKPNPSLAGDVIFELSAWFKTLAPSSLVILIDEYDAPLTNCLDKSDLFNLVRSNLSRLFLTLKSNEGCLRFFFMTGITKFSNTSIFSAFNNLQDISLYPTYGTLLGYTEDEIRFFFKDYLTRAADRLHLTEQQILEQLRENYDGFSFDMDVSSHVYCPWSVLNFLNYPELGFQNYWYTSGGQPTVLMKYLTNHALQSPSVYDEPILVSLSELSASRQYDEISIEALLTQAGYLTIKEKVGGDYVRLGYPNEEVSRSMAQLYAGELLKGRNIAQSGVPILAKVMASETPETVVNYFNRALGSIDYVRYPIANEAACRAYLQVLLIGAALVPKVEVHNAHGRSDMEVEVGDRHWIFEFKYAGTGSEVETLLSQAVEQMKTQHYGESLSGRQLIRVALVFNGQERRFSAWQAI